MSRRYVGGELGAVVGYIYAESGITPVYVDENIAIYRKCKEVNNLLARFGALKKTRVCFCDGIVCLEAI